MFVYGMWMWYREGWNIKNTWNKPQVRRLLLVTAVMLVLFAIMFVAPGNWNRFETEFDIEQPQNIAEFGIAMAKCIVMFMYMMVFYLPYHLIAIALGAWAGANHPIELSVNRKKTILITLCVAVVYLLICVAPLAYLSNGFQIQRNYIQVGFFYVLTFFALGYFWFNQKKKDSGKTNRSIQLLMYVCTLFLIVIMGLNIKQDLPVVRAYHQAHKVREPYLVELQEKGQKETVLVEPYPSTSTPDAKYNVLKWLGKTTSMQAIYYEGDTDVEPNEYEMFFRKLYHLDYDFVLTEKRK